jgi:hypothetical protein
MLSTNNFHPYLKGKFHHNSYEPRSGASLRASAAVASAPHNLRSAGICESLHRSRVRLCLRIDEACSGESLSHHFGARPQAESPELKWWMITGDGHADRIRSVSLDRRQLERTPAVWCRDPIVLPARISLPATPRGRANLPIRVHPRRRFSQQKTPAPCPRPRR